jgi:hypothetical protein
MCESAAPSTTNQNATQGTYIKDKVARKSLSAYIIKMQYEIVFKSDRIFMLYLPSSKFSCCCSNYSVERGSWYSSKGSASTHHRNAKTWSSTYIYIQIKTKDKKQYNIT